MTSVLRAKDNFNSNVKIIGYGQTWQVLTGSRFLNVLYTNNTGKPIQVAVTRLVHSGASSRSSYFYVDGVMIVKNTTGGTPSVDIRDALYVIVPDGSTYQATGSAVITTWSELR